MSFAKTLKYKLKSAVEDAFGVAIYRRLPRGIDPLSDLSVLVPKWEANVIFDVGANVGQSAVAYAKRFPAAQIFSFEPAAETFRHLRQNVIAFRNVECIPMALAAVPGEGKLMYAPHSEMRRIESLEGAVSGPGEIVEKQTLDTFCAHRAIAKIHYLKIDTEGADLEVLQGAERMLRAELIEVIEVEAGVGLDNDLHVPLSKFREYLENFGYQVFGFYDQMYEWKRSLPHLRRSNVVFISTAVERSNRQ